MKVLILVGLICLPLVASYTNFLEPVLFQCPPGQSIFTVYSRHGVSKKDRQYTYRCRSTFPKEKCTAKCQWTGYVNKFTEMFFFQCPKNGIISGVHSYYDNHQKDRRIQYYCCYPQDKHLANCVYHGYANTWRGVERFTVPTGSVLRGVFSDYDDEHKDRRMKYETCTLH